MSARTASASERKLSARTSENFVNAKFAELYFSRTGKAPAGANYYRLQVGPRKLGQRLA
jgi:hypothetical protein